MKKRGTLACILSLLLCLAFSLCGCGERKATVNWELDEVGTVELHTPLQLSYLSGNYNDILQYASGMEELSRPAALTLSWSAEPQGGVISSYTVEYTTGEFPNGIAVRTTAPQCEITNLLLDSVYLWRVTAEFENGETSVSPVSAFVTGEKGPRNLYVDGITNVRDLGGWSTANGGKVKQGMIFRCGRLNKSKTATPEIEITRKGIDTMLNEFGIKTEIDLRMKEAHDHESGGITASPLGSTVRYENVELEWEKGNYLLDNLASVKKFFELAADENNYPFIFHCDIGTDRTGMFAYLINGLLGVSEEDLYRDYLFSDFGKIGGARQLSNIQNNYIKTVKAAEGETLSEKIKNCLIANGVPAAHLNALVAIMK